MYRKSVQDTKNTILIFTKAQELTQFFVVTHQSGRLSIRRPISEWQMASKWGETKIMPN